MTGHIQAFLAALLFASLPFHALADTPPPGTVKAKLYDAAGNALTSTGGKLDVNSAAALPPDASTATLQGIGNAALASILSQLQGVISITGTVTASGAVSVSNLPANPATSTLQATGNTSAATTATNTGTTATNTASTTTAVTAMSAKLPSSVGAKAKTLSLSVTRASDEGPLPVTIGATVNAVLDSESTTDSGASLKVMNIAGAGPFGATRIAAKQNPAGFEYGLETADIILDYTVASSGDTAPPYTLMVGGTQSGALIPFTLTGGSLNVNLTGGSVTVAGSTGRTWTTAFLTDSMDVSGSSVNVLNFPASQAVTGPATDAQLRATPLPVTGSLALTSPVNLNGSGSSAGATVSTVATLTAPANAVGFVLMNLDTSTTNMRWAVGRAATATLGQQLQPGRDSGFVPVGANVSIIAESGTVNYDVQWVSQ